MTYRISGLGPEPFLPLAGLSDQALAARGVRRYSVTAQPDAPCRLSLDDAPVGATMLLLNHDTVPEGPHRASHAIFVTEGARSTATFVDEVPPALARRVL